MSSDEVTLLKVSMDNLKGAVESLATTQKEMHEKQARILVALVGDDLGTTGLVRRVADQEEKTAGYDKKMIRWGGFVAGVSFVLALLKDELASLLLLRK